jgi:hypothetical protein
MFIQIKNHSFPSYDIKHFEIKDLNESPYVSQIIVYLKSENISIKFENKEEAQKEYDKLNELLNSSPEPETFDSDI